MNTTVIYKERLRMVTVFKGKALWSISEVVKFWNQANRQYDFGYEAFGTKSHAPFQKCEVISSCPLRT